MPCVQAEGVLKARSVVVSYEHVLTSSFWDHADAVALVAPQGLVKLSRYVYRVM